MSDAGCATSVWDTTSLPHARFAPDSQCARALMRVGLWAGADLSDGLPMIGEMLREITDGGFNGAAYDEDWPARAARTLW